MKKLAGLSLLALSLALTACGSSETGNGAAPAKSLPSVAAPAGTSWSTTVAATPEGGFVMGNPNAAVRVGEYGSYTCSHCAEFSKESAEEIKKLVDTGKVSYELRNYVRDRLDLAISLVARCGGKDSFFPMSEQIFASQEAIFKAVQDKGDAAYQAAMTAPAPGSFAMLADMAGMIEFAKQRGVAEDQLKLCLADNKAATALSDGVTAANSKYNIQGTPTILINGVSEDNLGTWPALRNRLRELGV